MPAFTATAPGKIILFGEHAVVYGRPAIAVPVAEVRARAAVRPEIGGPPGRLTIEAPEIFLKAPLDQLPANHPLREAALQVISALNIQRVPACTVRITSNIPVAAGMGSGAAVSVALIRALSAFLGHPLPDEQVSALAFEVEKLYHGTPSGIDNTVVTYGQPVFFQRSGSGEASSSQIIMLAVGSPFTLVIADTGISTPTSIPVGEVRLGWQAAPEEYEAMFDTVGKLTGRARQFIETGQATELGPLLDENHTILQRLGVSCPELDTLVAAARQAGALGAKLSGGGRGGNMLALVRPEEAARVSEALREAGAVRTLTTVVGI